ncbi:MAG: hypothetical protein V8R80_05665 [Eubacterium sp.]
MVFSSLVFISIFLPAVLILSWVLPSVTAKNILLLVASLLFYEYGEPVYVFLMLGSAFLNYLWALLIEKYRNTQTFFLVIAVVQNLAVLGVFKYAGFLVELLIGWTGLQIPVPQLALPVGISFFTFQAMSYVIDVYRKEVHAPEKFYPDFVIYFIFPTIDCRTIREIS